jgi:hypothetical protein
MLYTTLILCLGLIIISIALCILYKHENRSSTYEFFSPIPTTSYKTDIADLDQNTYYIVGTRKISNTTSPAQNGGEACPVEFPQTIYVEAPVRPADCITRDSNPVLDDTYYEMGTTAIQGITIFPRYFTTNVAINIPVTTTTADTAVKSISYNEAGHVLIVGMTSGFAYWSSNFGTATQSFNLLPSGTVTFGSASIGRGNFVMANRVTPTNDSILYFRNTNPTSNWATINDRDTYYAGTQSAIGTVPGIQGSSSFPTDNVLFIIGTNGDLYLQQQGASWFRWMFSQQPRRVSSISLDQTVATAVIYVPPSGTTLATSTIFMVSFQAGGNVSRAPGGIGAEIATANTSSFRRVVGNPSNITYVCAGEDLRAFAINSEGKILICNNITTASTPSDWKQLPLPSGTIFSKVFYRKTINDIVYAIDNTGRVYVQRNVDAMFTREFNLIPPSTTTLTTTA